MRPGGRICLTLSAALLCGAAIASGWHWPAGRPAPHVPADNLMQAAKVELGRRLFYDADLSADGSMACSTCHVQRHAFADSTRTRPGVHGDAGRRNVPGLANVAWARSLTWGDPHVKTLEAQVLIPVLGQDPVEMGMHGQEAEIARRLGKDACYGQMFRSAFPEAQGRIDMTSVAKALSAFERTLISTNAPYDRWRRGDQAALSPTERAGERLFTRDCASCHAGPDLSDGRFHRIEPATADRGLGAITGKASDDGRFRTPNLRNVALTGPYLHDGSATTIADAIARHLMLKGPAQDERMTIIAFLGAMTDKDFVGEKAYALPDSACGVAL